MNKPKDPILNSERIYANIAACIISVVVGIITQAPIGLILGLAIVFCLFVNLGVKEYNTQKEWGIGPDKEPKN